MKIYIIGVLFISIIGTLLHFTYDFSKHNKIVAIFSAVNESTWEHIKMALTASLIWMIVELIYFASDNTYYLAKDISLLTIIIIIPLIFYSYQKITKKPVLVIDILSFFIAIILSQLFGYLVLQIDFIPKYLQIISYVLLIIISIIYLLFTFFPPKHFIFLDPLTKKYGIKGHFINKK